MSKRITHGASRNGVVTPEYSVWRAMKKRCANPKDDKYSYYGGRGIAVCQRWRDSFADFLADMGSRPDGYTIDRIDTNLGYEPGNCKWSSRKEQTRNRRVTVLESHEPDQIRWLRSEGYSNVEIARHFGIHPCTVNDIFRGRSWV